jgi:hypothetical protein
MHSWNDFLTTYQYVGGLLFIAKGIKIHTKIHKSVTKHFWTNLLVQSIFDDNSKKRLRKE